METVDLFVTVDELLDMSVDEMNEMVDEQYGALTSDIAYDAIGVQNGQIHILATFSPAE